MKLCTHSFTPVMIPGEREIADAVRRDKPA
jgi:hypothetical protein